MTVEVNETLTAAQVAQMLQVSERTVKYLVTTRQIAFTRVGKRIVRFSEESIGDWLKKSENVELRYNKN